MLPEVVSPSALIPPAPMRLRVAGTEDLAWFHVSGRLSCEVFGSALAGLGRELAEFRRVLDFGCGAGRVLRWLRPLMPEARFAGSDSDHEALAWVGAHFPGVTLAAVGHDGLPPIAFHDAAFDLVLGYSVFTHLDVDYQDAWLAELARLIDPAGLLLLTISGPRMLDHTLTKSGHGNLADLERLLPRFAADGVLHWRGEGWERLFPDYYHTTFHSHAYVRAHWSRWFDVLGILDDTPAEMPQDVVVLRPRGGVPRPPGRRGSPD